MREKWTGRLVGDMFVNHVTINDLAKELGFSQAYVSMMLNGTRRKKDAKELLQGALDHILEVRESET